MRKPAEVFDPRDFLDEEMSERGMTETNLPMTVRRWRDSGGPVTPKVAHALSALLATSPEFWINLDAAWRAEP